MLHVFLYGFFSSLGLLAVVVVVVFQKARALSSARLQRLIESLQADTTVVEHAAKLDPIKVMSVVKVCSYENFLCGEIKSARCVMIGATMTFYEVLSAIPDSSSAASGWGEGSDAYTTEQASLGHRSRVTSERLIGRIVVQNIDRELGEIQFDRSAPMSGNVLLLKKKEGQSALFVASNVFYGDGGAASPSGWEQVTCIAVKFSTRRELDRWCNLFAAIEHQHSIRWRAFLTTCPQIDALNVLIGRIFFEQTSGTQLSEFMRHKIVRKLRKVNLPKPLSGRIVVQRLHPGSEAPIFRNFSLVSISTNGEVALDFDVLYRGGFEVSLEAQLSLSSVSVPNILFRIKVLEISGRLHVSIGPPPTNKFWLGFHKPPNVRLDFSQQVAAEGVLSTVMGLVPDLSDVIANLVKLEVFEDMLLPQMDDFNLPNLGKTPPSSPEVEPRPDPLPLVAADFTLEKNAILPPTRGKDELLRRGFRGAVRRMEDSPVEPTPPGSSVFPSAEASGFPRAVEDRPPAAHSLPVTPPKSPRGAVTTYGKDEGPRVEAAPSQPLDAIKSKAAAMREVLAQKAATARRLGATANARHDEPGSLPPPWTAPAF
jgi:hypothetical protein